MTRAREGEVRGHGMGLMARFALAMTVALSLVMAIAGYTLFRSSTNIAQSVFDESISSAVRMIASSAVPSMLPALDELESAVKSADGVPRQELQRLVSELGVAVREVEGLQTYRLPSMEQAASGARTKVKGVDVVAVHYGEDGAGRGELYQLVEGESRTQLLVPAPTHTTGSWMLRLILSLMLVVVLVGAGVAMWVAYRVSQPIHDLAEDVRTISKGHLNHRIRARGGGEVELLARSVERMTVALAEAREAELELSIRKREVELAAGVREALIPLVTPEVRGYDVGGAQLAADQIDGDLYDYIELADGRIGLLVCDVSGQGLPAALIGATARAYLRSELRHGTDARAALFRVNRELARDVRRGMFVTALYALVDPVSHAVEVYCAGHKLPLLRWSAAEKKLRLIHPEGIALGFDPGPVFERSIESQKLQLAPGDRLLLANTAPVRLADAQGRELGEKGFYTLVLKHAAQPTPQFLKAVRKGLEDVCGAERFPADISLVTIRRES